VTVQRGLTIAAIILVAAGVIAAFLTIGPPQEARKRSLDQLRIGDLYRIADHFRDEAVRGRAMPAALPSSIDAPYDRSDDRPVTVDPQTRITYAYHRLDRQRYRLCARFDTSTMAKAQDDSSAVRFWAHPAGLTCFSFDAHTAPPLADVVDPPLRPML
jgi:hypothetical protein